MSIHQETLSEVEIQGGLKQQPMTWVELAPVSWAMPTIQGTGEEPGCTPATGGLWFPIPGM